MCVCVRVRETVCVRERERERNRERTGDTRFQMSLGTPIGQGIFVSRPIKMEANKTAKSKKEVC